MKKGLNTMNRKMSAGHPAAIRQTQASHEQNARQGGLSTGIAPIALVLSAFALAGCQTVPAQSKVSEVSPQELREKLDHHAPVLLVFAYTQVYFARARIEGAIPAEELRARIPTLAKDVEIILYCGCPKDQASHELAEELTAADFSNVRILDGGILAWINAGNTLAPPSQELSKEAH
jgi:rhodanese-related sulfurtransferase